MKPKNFPARKLARQIRANGGFLIEHKQELDNALMMFDEGNAYCVRSFGIVMI